MAESTVHIDKKTGMRTIARGFTAIMLIAGPCMATQSAAHTETAVSSEALAGLRAQVEQELKLWHAVGVSIAVVQDGRIILLEGYGQRDIDRNLPMTADTVQPVASVTKNITVAALATLARDGRLDWDRPVREYLPDFRLATDYATATVTTRDMVTHRTGLPRHDFAWVRSAFTREDLVRRLRHFELSAEPRTKFQYNNLMYATAGYLGGRIAGGTWESLVKNRIFEPLGMKTASTSVKDMSAAAHAGRGYSLDRDFRPRAAVYTDAENIGPAGAINASARDMANYLLMLTGKGRFHGKTVVAENDLAEMTSPQMALPDARRFAEVGASQYGMGFFLSTYRGERVVSHGGNLRGLSSLISFMPQRNLGMFIAVNTTGSSLPTVLSYALYDRLLKLPPIDWSARYREIRDRGNASQQAAEAQNLSPRKPGTHPGHVLAEYAGQYEHPGYGVVTVALAGEQLTAAYNASRSPLVHYHYDVFAAPQDPLNDLADMKFDFRSDVNGDVSSLALLIEPLVKPIVFAKRPDARFQDPVFLAPLAGDYQVGANTASIVLRADNVLVMAMPGQPLRTLRGIAGTRFAVEGVEAYTIEFLADGAGRYTRAAFYQPGGNYVAPRKSPS